MTTKKRGRPKGSGKYPKEYRIRLTEDEFQAIKDQSKSENKKMSYLIRDAIDMYLGGKNNE